MKRMMSIVLCGLFAPTAYGAQAQTLFTAPLEFLPGDPEVVVRELTLSPGSTSQPHRHDAYVYVYVVEGSVDMQVEGGELQRVSVGQMFVETPDDVHLVMTNPSATEFARFVAFIIKAAGAPGSLPVDRETDGGSR